MVISIPTLTEIEEIVEKCLVKHLSNDYALLNKQGLSDPLQDRIGLNEAMEITGLKQSAIYKMTMQGTIPHEKFGKRLVFSRRELEAWMKEQTVRKQSPEDIASEHLAKVARKRLNK
ncbi:MAG TPA: helix-turn-helix domain-containing protein [Bacteroidales bacterium]|nr:helix-turn-helix domain-containing protein [Bacteroidales bacterium]HQK68635.1 helix-turn-helix domain-containing protein [Bacteroidales bacterium]